MRYMILSSQNLALREELRIDVLEKIITDLNLVSPKVDWGDGEWSPDNAWVATHQYTKLGSYTITLFGTKGTAHPDLIFIETVQVSVDIIGYTLPALIHAGIPAKITASTALSLLAIEYGDGCVEYASSGNHVYQEGKYLLKIKSSNNTGDYTETRQIEIIVFPAFFQYPTFVSTVRKGKAPLTVRFGYTGPEGDEGSYFWDFGDGTTSTERYPVHTYTKKQSYTIKLVLTFGKATRTTISEDFIIVTEYDEPVANFSMTPDAGSAPLTVSLIDTSTGPITESYWDFGNGLTSNTKDELFTFSFPGLYSVKRLVKNPDWISELERWIYVQYPDNLVNMFFTPSTGFAPLNMVFRDTITLPFTKLIWNFGDGITYTGHNPSHVYSSPGSYTISLTVYFDSFQYPTIITRQVTVLDPALLPIADFTADVVTGQPPLSVRFTDTSSNNPTSWLWDFGDGGTSTEKNPVHAYSYPGEYTVKLTATNSIGPNTVTKPAFIHVVAPPVAAFTADHEIGHVPISVHFTDTSTNTPTSWLWDFGDGGTSTEKNPVHTFTGEKSFWVSLTVTNAYGTATTGMDITALPANYPISSFTYLQKNKRSPFLVQFTDTSTGTVTSWLWDFGDGGTSTEKNPVHAYSYPGEYLVTLAASNADNVSTGKKRIIVG